MNRENEDEENKNRRDDVMERQFIRTDGDEQEDRSLRHRMAETTIQQANELFDARMRQRNEQDHAVNADRARVAVQRDEIYGLTFRDAAIHSTAVGSLEGEIATVGDEEEENVPDEEHAPGQQ